MESSGVGDGRPNHTRCHVLPNGGLVPILRIFVDGFSDELFYHCDLRLILNVKVKRKKKKDRKKKGCVVSL